MRFGTEVPLPSAPPGLGLERRWIRFLMPGTDGHYKFTASCVGACVVMSDRDRQAIFCPKRIMGRGEGASNY